MPYINKNARQNYDDIIEELSIAIANRGHLEGYQTLAGDLNYSISTLLHKTYINAEESLSRCNPKDCLGKVKEKRVLSYSEYNEIIGILECAKMEVYRRLVVPYEDKKIEQNTDVFEKVE